MFLYHIAKGLIIAHLFPQPSKRLMPYNIRQHSLLSLNTSLHRLSDTISMKERPRETYQQVDKEWIHINLCTS